MKKINFHSSKKETIHNKTVELVRLIKNGESDGKIATVNHAWLNKENVLAPHSHPDGIEYYIFTKGKGQMLAGEDWHNVVEGDFILIPKSTIHSLKNDGENPLEFITIRTIE